MGVVQELRQSPRVLITQLVVGFPDGDRYVRGNISSGGVGFELDELIPVEVGDPITVRLDVPETLEPLVFSALVRHTHYDRDGSVQYVGARFIEVDELSQNPLERFVEEAVLLEKTPSGAVRMPGF